MGTISMCPCTCLFENNLICIKNKFSKIWLNLEISVDIIACWGRNFEPKLTTLEFRHEAMSKFTSKSKFILGWG